MSKYFTGKLRTKILERDNYTCVNCGCHENLEIDHIKCLSTGGETSYTNGQVMCRKCNQEKNRYTSMYYGWFACDRETNEVFVYRHLYTPLNTEIISKIINSSLTEIYEVT